MKTTLVLLPYAAATPEVDLSFSSTERQFHSFTFQPRFTFQPPQQRTKSTILKIKWYYDRDTAGHCEWKAEVVPLIPNVNNRVPESCADSSRCTTWPVERLPSHSATLSLTIPPHVWHYSLVIYRDAANPLDTAAAWAIVTDVQIIWEYQWTDASTS
jgi:hypothetical protein